MTTCRTSLFYRQFLPYYAGLRKYYNRVTAAYNPLTVARTGPWPAAARVAKRTQGIRDYTAAGHREHTGIGGRGQRQGSTVHNLDKLAADGTAAQA